MNVDSGMPHSEDRQVAWEGDSGSFFQKSKGMDKVTMYVPCLLSEQMVAGMSSWWFTSFFGNCPNFKSDKSENLK